jgi:excisionase family DNA binding protein
MATHRSLTTKQVCEALNLSASTFFDLKRAGKLPMVEELKPRLGRLVRYRADLIERYLAGQWGQPRSFASHRLKRTA